MDQMHPQPELISTLIVTADFKDYSDQSDDDPNNPGSGTGSAGPGSASGPMSSGPAGPVLSGPAGGGAGGSGGSDLSDALIDYNDRFAGTVPALYRDAVVDRTMAALISKSKPNALLKGPAGVGKTRVVEEVARRITDGHPSVPPSLRDKIIYELPLSALVAGASLVGEMEARINQVIEFASDPANRAILFIDEIHQIVMSDAGGGSNHYDKIAQQLKPAMARGDIRIIGATTNQESRRLDNDPAFSRRLTHVGVAELEQDQTIEILESMLPTLTAHYRGQISVDPALIPDLIHLADAHLVTLHRPDSALTLLDRTMASAAIRLNKLIAEGIFPEEHIMALNRAMILETAESMHGSDAGRLGYNPEDLRERLREIRGQDGVCDKVVDKLTRTKLQLFRSQRPQTWMFAGPSGVGKTRVAQIVAEVLLGTKPILLNMAEYAEKHAISSLIGSPPGYVGSTSNKEMPFDPLESNPYQVIVLDEFEKCHTEIQRLFLGAMDNGTMRTAAGKTLDFSKALIIATTNAGRDELAKGGLSLGFGTGGPTQAHQMSRQQLTKALSSVFEPELLGRFTWLTAFSAIDEATYTQIAADAYVRLRDEVAATNPVAATDLPEQMPADALEELVADQYSRAQGARTAIPAVREWIEEAVIAASVVL